MILKNGGRGRPRSPGKGLSGLDGVPLGYNRERMLDAAIAGSSGPAPWRMRKIAEARELLALSRIAPDRLTIEQLDLSVELRAVVLLKVPVPTRRPGDDEIVLADSALLGLQYRQEALLTPQPGASFVQILQPQGVFHPQVPPSAPQALCLAPVLTPGIPARELVLLSYAAISMQHFQINAGDPAGVFNVEAAEWYQANPALIPTTTDPFLPAAEGGD